MAQTTHFSSFWLFMHRVIEDQETCHDGLLGSFNTFRLFRFETSVLGLDQDFHSLTKVA